MQSVRYLIKMRDEKKALREAKEKEEREKLGLPPKVKIKFVLVNNDLVHFSQTLVD